MPSPHVNLELPRELADKRDRLLALLAGYGRVAVAFSGGVDSAIVAQAAHLACGPQAVAFTAVSQSLASGEREEAELLARSIGIVHRIIETQEFENPDYLQNAPDRCYHCKTELYTQLERVAPELGFDTIVNGANLDDAGDYRPGMKAAGEHRVRSPLIEAGFTKDDVRALAQHWGLAVWDKPATPCLSSRVAYGLEVTPERVRRVDEAERFLRAELGLRELRVRHEANDLARIEVPRSELARVADGIARERVCEELHRLGFKYVTLDLDGFRSGSMNAALSLVQIDPAARVAASHSAN
ncbi:MAG: ATP-dependent sacrificial sulfur transferase LarE [Planctomycetia bacterium]|nr:ATP-dependent sacrificial sulfur transferase LarE [Planctomycetia bacterium]